MVSLGLGLMALGGMKWGSGLWTGWGELWGRWAEAGRAESALRALTKEARRSKNVVGGRK